MITHSFSFSYLSFSLKNSRCGLVNRSGDFSCVFRHAVSPHREGATANKCENGSLCISVFLTRPINGV